MTTSRIIMVKAPLKQRINITIKNWQDEIVARDSCASLHSNSLNRVLKRYGFEPHPISVSWVHKERKLTYEIDGLPEEHPSKKNRSYPSHRA